VTPRRHHALVVALLAALSLPACGGASPGAPDDDARASQSRAVRITFGDAQLTGRLDDNATARDLADQLPLTLTFRDHNDVEKTAPLPRELSIDGAPAGHDPAAGDIGYWAPGGDLVLYYDDGAPFFDGIVRIGELVGDTGPLEREGEDLEVTIDQAG
jgi:hypothetical protein